MIPMPFRVQIPEDERIIGMDKAAWWEASGELPTIFTWALLGLARMRKQGRFTKSWIVDRAREEYREEMNPARMFLKQFVEQSNSGAIQSRVLYKGYCLWTRENGYRPLSEKSFGKEVHRMFSTELKKKGDRSFRFYQYEKIQFSTEEICGEKIDNIVLPGF
jgi:phage/plasmid-associated DNA primase